MIQKHIIKEHFAILKRAVTQSQGQDEVLLTANLKRNMSGAESIKLFFCKGKKGRPSLE